jgi:hypothetical protein
MWYLLEFSFSMAVSGALELQLSHQSGSALRPQDWVLTNCVHQHDPKMDLSTYFETVSRQNNYWRNNGRVASLTHPSVLSTLYPIHTCCTYTYKSITHFSKHSTTNKMWHCLAVVSEIYQA